MNKIILDNRLLAAAKYVRPRKIVADIGTDHAYLPVYLLQNNISPKALACDINELPLESAKRTVEQYELTDFIEVRLSNGLINVEPQECDDIVICGMGGELIATILDNSKWVQNQRYNLILNPMTKPEKLRKYLFDNGFDIVSETASESHKKHYTVMNVKFTNLGIKYDTKLLFFGRLLDNNDEQSRKYVEMTAKRMLKKANGLKINNADEITANELISAVHSVLGENFQ